MIVSEISLYMRRASAADGVPGIFQKKKNALTPRWAACGYSGTQNGVISDRIRVKSCL